MSQWSFCAASLSVCLCVVGMLGCGGGSDTPKVYPVKGTVKIDGKPVDGATLTFNPTNGRPSVGVTDANGVYYLRYTEKVDGALPGEHLVQIRTERFPSGGEGSPVIPGRKEMLPAHYHDKSDLKVEVKTEENQLDFDLKSKAP